MSRPIWNWKSAALSVMLRTPLFFLATCSAGLGPATLAVAVDIPFRAALAGLCGGLVQRVIVVKPRWLGTLTVFLAVPVLSHAAEVLVHHQANTPHLSVAVAMSVAMTVVTTSFDLYLMRHGAFVTGEGSGRLIDDLARVPRLIRALGRDLFTRPRPGRLHAH